MRPARVYFGTYSGVGTSPTFPSHAGNESAVDLAEPIPESPFHQRTLAEPQQHMRTGGMEGDREREMMRVGIERQAKGYWDSGSSLSYESGCDRWNISGGLGSSIPSDEGRRSYEISPIPFEIGKSPRGTSPIDPILLEAAKVYHDDDESNALNRQPTKTRNDESYENEEVGEIEPEGHRRKRKRLTTDLEKAHLVRLCINNFGRYGMGRDKFFSSIGLIYGKEKNAPPPDVKSWMIRRENERKKEVAEGKS